MSSNKNEKRKSGNSNKKFDKRKKILKLRDDISDELHLLLELEDGESPLILIELNEKEWKKYQPTSISLSDIVCYTPPKKMFFTNKSITTTLNLVRNFKIKRITLLSLKKHS